MTTLYVHGTPEVQCTLASVFCVIDAWPSFAPSCVVPAVTYLAWCQWKFGWEKGTCLNRQHVAALYQFVAGIVLQLTLYLDGYIVEMMDG
jgi:hypothetical protein